VDVTVGQAVAVARDVSFVAGVLIAGFKVRSWLQPLVDFFSDAKKFMSEVRLHMTATELSMNVLLTNHIPHLEDQVKKIVEKIETIN
jgi:hypothetical protein